MSCLTAISNVIIVGSMFLDVKKLSFSLSDSSILGLWSDVPKYASNFILSKTDSKSFSIVFCLVSGGRNEGLYLTV